MILYLWCHCCGACRDILRAQAGLAEHHDNYHEFCRLLGRLKTNYQLSELVSRDVTVRLFLIP
jgi:exportin-7